MIGDLDGLLLQAGTCSSLLDIVEITMHSLEDLEWFLSRRKSVLIPSKRLEYLGLIFNSEWAN